MTETVEPKKFYVRCWACEAMAIYDDRKDAETAADDWKAVKRYVKEINGEKALFIGFGKFDHHCIQKGFETRHDPAPAA